jgi:hypothetical protein
MLLNIDGISKVPDFCTAFVHQLCRFAAGVLRCCREIQTPSTDTTKRRRVFCHEELQALQNCYTLQASCSLLQPMKSNETCNIYDGLPPNSSGASRNKTQWEFGVVTFALVVMGVAWEGMIQ